MDVSSEPLSFLLHARFLGALRETALRLVELPQQP